MKSILMPIQPKWCELIASGKKTIEVRKTRPKLETPFKVYIYCCKPKKILRYVWTKKDYEGYPFAEGMDENEKVFCKIPDGSSPFCSSRYACKVIGEFVCDDIFEFNPTLNLKEIQSKHINFVDNACINMADLFAYAKGKTLYGWHISDLKIYDKPKELSEFHRPCPIDDCTKCEHYHWKQDPCHGRTIRYCDVEPLIRPPQSYCYVEEI